MNERRIWSRTEAETTFIVVLQEGVVYCGQVEESKQAEVVKQIEDGGDPAALLDKKHKQAALDDITRVVANNHGNLVIECGDETIKSPMQAEGVKILETIQDNLDSSWQVDVRSKMRIGSAIIAVLIGLAFGAGLTWIYFGVVAGEVERMHWLGALLVNTFGAVSLLVLAALIFLGAMIAAGYYIANPSEVWTLEQE